MADRDMRAEVAWGSRMLALDGHADMTLGHLSARLDAGRVLMKRSEIALSEVTAEDVLSIDLEGNKLEGRGRIHLEAVLHTVVYRNRPDVGAVVHSHPPFATALGATDGQLELLSHDAVLFHDGLGVFDGPAELITAAEQAQAVASALGDRRAVLLRNHGVLTVGKDVRWAVITAMTLERALRLQLIAASLGPLRPMDGELAKQMFPSKYHDGLIEDYWQYLIREVRRRGLASGMPYDGQ